MEKIDIKSMLLASARILKNWNEIESMAIFKKILFDSVGYLLLLIRV